VRNSFWASGWRLCSINAFFDDFQRLNTQYGVSIPLILMNSFNTDEEISRVLVKYQNVEVKVECFQQTKHLRIDKETLLPIVKTLDPKEGWEGWDKNSYLHYRARQVKAENLLITHASENAELNRHSRPISSPLPTDVLSRRHEIRVRLSGVSSVYSQLTHWD